MNKLNRTFRSSALTHLALSIGAMLLSSCTLGPDYTKPQMEVPAVFRGAPSMEKSIADLPWWKVIRDPNLRQLLLDTYQGNKDLKAIIANVNTAQQYVTIASAPLFPWLSYGGNISRGANSSGGSNIVAASGSASTSGVIGANASWEIDIWGKTRRGVEAAKADLQSTEQQVRALQLSLLNQVATAYLQLLMFDEQLRISRKTVESYQKSLNYYESRVAGEVDNILSVESTKAALAAAQARIPDLESSINSLENTLSVLAGRMPGRIKRSGSILGYSRAGRLPSGIPASVLANRPDVQAAERSICSANAKIGIAIANYFPSISITGVFGAASADLVRESWQHGWGMGASITGPLFQAGTLKASENIARNDLVVAVANYEKTVLSALAEVSSTLVSRDKLRRILNLQEKAVKSYRKSLEIAVARYDLGDSLLIDVLNAQQNLFTAELQLAQYQYEFAATIPSLYTQLGGGWKNSNDEIRTGNYSAKPKTIKLPN